MTVIKLKTDGEGLSGFELKGHSSFDCDDVIGKTVCAAVSSAAIMAANTVEEVLKCSCKSEMRDGYLDFTVVRPTDAARAVLKGFELHINGLCEQYGDRIRVITEV